MSGLNSFPKITEVIPHREPFLFIDKILEVDEKKIIAAYQVKGTESFFEGHFPGRPIMPGVLMLESMAQAAVYLAGVHYKEMKGIPLLTRINNARFRKAVCPPEELRIEVEIIRASGNKKVVIFHFNGEIFDSGGSLVAQAEITGVR